MHIVVHMWMYPHCGYSSHNKLGYLCFLSLLLAAPCVLCLSPCFAHLTANVGDHASPAFFFNDLDHSSAWVILVTYGC